MNKGRQKIPQLQQRVEKRIPPPSPSLALTGRCCVYVFNLAAINKRGRVEQLRAEKMYNIPYL
jgi:hypothetical protein